MLTKYELFLENINLQRIDEAILYYSDKLRMILSVIKSDISKDLLSIEDNDVKPDITLIDLDKEGYFSFTTERNVKKKLADYYGPETVDLAYEVGRNVKRMWKEQGDSFVLGKQSVRIGKLVNRLFPSKYKDTEVEKFINKVKSLIERSGEKISVVSGEDIAYWYSEQNYFSLEGQLGSSCMRKSDFFDIYVQNPEVCKMVILTEFEKLKGRALLWKVNHSKFEWFMDRQYTNFEHDVEKFRDYAISSGFAYRTHNDCYSSKNVTFDVEIYVNLVVNLNKDEVYDSYPYMDTFKMYYPESHRLENTNEGSGYLLESTGGGYNDLSGNWSSYYDESIPSEESIYSEPLNDYIWVDSAVEVRHGSREYFGFYPEEHRLLCFDSYNSRFLHTRDAVYSEKLSTYLLLEESVFAIYKFIVSSPHYRLDYKTSYIPYDSYNTIEKWRFDKMKWYKKIKEMKSETDELDILEDVLIKDKDGNFIPEAFKVEVFKVTDEDLYLSSADAKLLVKEIDTEAKIIDLVNYNTSLHKSGLLDEIVEKSDSIYRYNYVFHEDGGSVGSDD